MKNLFIFFACLTFGFTGTLFYLNKTSTPQVPTETYHVNTFTKVNSENRLVREPMSQLAIKSLKVPADQVVTIVGPIGEEAQAIANDILLKASKGKPVYVAINSPGGSVMDGALIVSAIEAAKAPVYTVCMSLCASMAAIIFEYGSTRYMINRATLMFHPASGGVQGTLEQMNSRLGYISRYVDKMDDFIAKRSGTTLEVYKARTVSEQWIDAEDSLGFKLTDGIVSLDLTGSEPIKQSVALKINKRFPWNHFTFNN